MILNELSDNKLNLYLPEPNSDSVLTHTFQYDTGTGLSLGLSLILAFSQFNVIHIFGDQLPLPGSAGPLRGVCFSIKLSISVSFLHPDCIVILSARELHPWDTWHVTSAAVMSVLTPALSSFASCPPVSRSGPNFHPDSRRALNRPDSQNRPGQLISLINKAELMTISHQGLLITTKADTNACYIMKVGWQELPRGQCPVTSNGPRMQRGWGPALGSGQCFCLSSRVLAGTMTCDWEITPGPQWSPVVTVTLPIIDTAWHTSDGARPVNGQMVRPSHESMSMTPRVMTFSNNVVTLS